MKYTHEDDDEIDWQTDDDDLDDGYVSCPKCGGMMLEAADYCPECHQWITDEDRASQKKPVWVYLVLAVILAATILAAFAG